RMQVVAEEPPRPAQGLESPLAGGGLVRGEGLAVAMIVLADEMCQVVADLSPLDRGPLGEPRRSGTPGPDGQRVEQMRAAEAIGARVGQLHLRIAGPLQQGPEIAALAGRGVLAHGAGLAGLPVTRAPARGRQP